MPSQHDLVSLNQALAHLCHDKIRIEGSRVEPNLRRLVAFANTLDALTEWSCDYFQQRALGQLHKSTQDELGEPQADQPDAAEGYIRQVGERPSQMKQDEDCIVTVAEVQDGDEEGDDDSVDKLESLKREIVEGSAKVETRPWRGHAPRRKTKDIHQKNHSRAYDISSKLICNEHEGGYLSVVNIFEEEVKEDGFNDSDWETDVESSPDSESDGDSDTESEASEEGLFMSSPLEARKHYCNYLELLRCKLGQDEAE